MSPGQKKDLFGLVGVVLAWSLAISSVAHCTIPLLMDRVQGHQNWEIDSGESDIYN